VGRIFEKEHLFFESIDTPKIKKKLLRERERERA